MKRLIYLAVCISILSLSGCANGLLGGCGNSCNQGGLFSGKAFSNGPFADGPVRQWLRGDECSTCNPPAGQPIYNSNTAPLCDACGQNAPMMNGFDPYSQGTVAPQGGMLSQPGIIGQPTPIQGGTVNSLYPDYSGAQMGGAGISGATIDGTSLDGSGFNNGLGMDNLSTFGGNVESAIEPPFNGSIDMN